VWQAQHLLLNTASLSILCYEHDRTGEPAIALWNSASHETFGAEYNRRAEDARPMKQRAIERWENEGGEIPDQRRSQTTRAEPRANL
jgi:probable phosphoglycerate mutase